jgi:hypothetical protein
MATFTIDGVYTATANVLVVEGEVPPEPSWSLPTTINVAQGSHVGIRQYAQNAGGLPLAVTNLGSGLSYNAGLERIEATAEATGSSTATFAIDPSGANITATATVTAVELGAWQLAEFHFTPAKMPMQLVYPRPSSELSTWARSRWAYPGLEYRIPIAVQGGAYPFYYEIITQPGGGQPNASIGQQYGQADYGILSWTPDGNGGPYTIEVRVTDQELNQVTAVIPVTVTDSTTRFIFVDPNAVTSGTGAIDSPLKETVETRDNGHNGKIVYFRAGRSYTFNEATQQTTWTIRSTSSPMAYLGYPGEEAIVDFRWGNFETKDSSSSNDVFIGGLIVENPRYNEWTGTAYIAARWWYHRAGLRHTVFENTFRKIRYSDAPNNSNQGLMHSGSSTNYRAYLTIWGNRAYELEGEGNGGRSWGSFYTTRYAVFEDNSRVAPHTISGTQTASQLLDLKSTNTEWSIRRCVVTGPGVNDSGNFMMSTSRRGSTTSNPGPLNVEFCYNVLIADAANLAAIRYDNASNNGGQPEVVDRTWIYRNTMHGYCDGGTGQNPYVVQFEQNVYLANSGQHYLDSLGSRTVEVGTGDRADLIGVSADLTNYLDEDYKLKGSYRTTYLGTRGHEIA